MDKNDKIWKEIKSKIEEKIGKPDFESWIKPLILEKIENRTVYLNVKSKFIKDWVDTNLSHVLLKVFREFLTEEQVDKILIIEGKNDPSCNSKSVKVESFQENNSLDKKLTFENFVVGKPNEFAYAAAQRVSSSDKVLFNPLFLYGGVGLGKTHLMNAIAWEIKEKFPKRKVVYLSAEKFMYKFVKALRFKDTVSFKEEFRNIDVLMVDDVQFFSTTNATQEEFFHTFNALVDNSKQVIISADKSPSDLENIQERLKSRMSWGLVADIHPTTYELRLGILQSKVEQLGVNIQNKVLEFLACKIISNVRELEGALNRIVAHSQLVGREIDIETTQEILRDLLRSNNRHISVDDIKKRVGEFFGVLKIKDLDSSKRLKNITKPRQVAMFLCKELTTKSLPEIGREFGGKDHTTVIYSVNKVKELIKKDAQFSEEVETLRKSLEISR